ncbi:39S ribosomal protein L34, mitochondrial [Orussus abietinus]|uniref:39S ribosomal protein L34, mitochondrial n=1 Tax=Orussus abietinus TaxID=222816 RepID=UPI00062671DC|nr:39S ribosomal protein L34, mitochondrial [Orussus abietinus]
MITGILLKTFRAISGPTVLAPLKQICSKSGASPILAPSACGNLTFVRTIVRRHFPRPSETKRIKVHGWLKRMSTPNGRKILMRRILKGRHVLSH